MSRWKAASIHLAISALIVLTVLGLVIWLWYPLALLRISGVLSIIGLLAMIDVVVGPLLTLIVFRHGKPKLQQDLTVIALLQVALLGYGLSVLAKNRPVFLAFAKDRFELVVAHEIDPDDLIKAPKPYRQLSWTGALLVGTRPPEDPLERSDFAIESLSGADIQHRPVYFVDYAQVEQEAKDAALPLLKLLPKLEPKERERLQTTGMDARLESLNYLAIRAKRGVALMLLGADSHSLLGPVDVDPWAVEERSVTMPVTK